MESKDENEAKAKERWNLFAVKHYELLNEYEVRLGYTDNSIEEDPVIWFGGECYEVSYDRRNEGWLDV